MGAKSRVKPAKMFMLRELPRTSERITVVLSPVGGEELDLGGEDGGGMAGPRLLFMGTWACLRVRAEEMVRVAKRRVVVSGRIVVVVRKL